MDTDFNTKLGNAFKAMRKQGLLARQNFSCCGGCASYALATKAKQKQEAGTPVKGYAFYHAQDAGNMRTGQDFYIGYDGINLSAVEVGKLVVDCLTAAGVKTAWTGDSSTRILVVNELPRKRRGW